MGEAGGSRVNSGEVASKVIDGEAILINLSNGMYYSLAGIGALVWALLEAGHADDRICAELEQRTGVDHATAVADLRRLLDELSAEGLIVAADASTAAAVSEVGDFPDVAAYTTPQLEKYSDMNDLLALDPPMPRLADIPWQSPAG
jgi:Coenzyme PQQ synthesis protein D (PqqD)